MSVTAEIISIGDELTSGERLDTNSQWISQQLNQLGIRVDLHTTVGDDYDSMRSAIRDAVARADLVVSTGGLGPTDDDLTRQVVANVAGVAQRLDEASLEHIQSLFASRNRSMPQTNVSQAYLPDGGQVIPNQFGTAPGIDFRFQFDGRQSRLFALPGVPAELKEMWNDYVVPEIKRDLPAQRVICHYAIHCFGAGESEIAARLPDIVRRGRIPQVGITASQATITLRITAEADTEQQCNEQIMPTATLIRQKLGSLVFGDSEVTLQRVVIDRLRELHQTISIVDCDLRGLVAQWLSDVDPHAAVLSGGWTTGRPVDIQRAAARALDFFESDLALLIEPLHQTDQGLQRTLWLFGGDSTRTATFDGNCHPDLLTVRSAKQALNWLRLIL